MLGLGPGSGGDVPIGLRGKPLDQEVDEDAHLGREVAVVREDRVDRRLARRVVGQYQLRRAARDLHSEIDDT